MDDGSMVTRPYDFDEVVRTLDAVVAHDWAAVLTADLERREPGAPLEGLERGGYRLVYRDHRNPFCKSFDAVVGQYDIRFSVGLTLGVDGTVQEVMWGSAAFDAGLTAGSLLETVNGKPYDEAAFKHAMADAAGGEPIRLTVKTRGRARKVSIAYHDGHRFPHLEPIPGARPRLDEILAPR
jgi:predicted metalloprotease with PDZ domain